MSWLSDVFGKAPDPPDLGPYADALKAQGEWGYKTAQEQLAWAKEVDAKNREILQQVLGVTLPAMQEQAANAKEDRARYESVFQPAENDLVKEFQNYGGPERTSFERGRAISDVSQSFDAARRNALQRLESYGIDPSQTRNAAMDLGVRVQEAAAQAQATTNATRTVEDKARAMRADVINIGRGMPSQIASSYAGAQQAGYGGTNAANQTFATSSGAIGTPGQFASLGQSGMNSAGNMTNMGYQNQMQQWNANQQQLQGYGQMIGYAAGMKDGGSGRKALTFENDGTGIVTQGPSDGSGIDDQVTAQISVGEYVIPADVVQKKGVEFFDKLVERYHTPAAQQRQALSWRHAAGGVA